MRRPLLDLSSRFRSPWTAAAVQAVITGVLFLLALALMDHGIDEHTVVGAGIFVVLFFVFSALSLGAGVRRRREDHAAHPGD